MSVCSLSPLLTGQSVSILHLVTVYESYNYLFLTFLFLQITSQAKISTWKTSENQCLHLMKYRSRYLSFSGSVNRGGEEFVILMLRLGPILDFGVLCTDLIFRQRVLSCLKSLDYVCKCFYVRNVLCTGKVTPTATILVNSAEGSQIITDQNWNWISGVCSGSDAERAESVSYHHRVWWNDDALFDYLFSLD